MWIVGAANWWKTWRIDCISKKWWTNRELTLFSVGGIHQEIELAVPIVVVWVQTSRTHLDRSSLFPSLVTPLNMFHKNKRSMYRCWWSWPIRDHGPTASPQLLLRPLRLLGTWLWSQENSSPKSFYKSSTVIDQVGYPIFQTQRSQPRTKRFQAPSPWKMRLPPGQAGAWVKSVKKLHGWYLHVQKSVSLI